MRSSNDKACARGFHYLNFNQEFAFNFVWYIDLPHDDFVSEVEYTEHASTHRLPHQSHPPSLHTNPGVALLSEANSKPKMQRSIPDP
jgi:hypothetical protein